MKKRIILIFIGELLCFMAWTVGIIGFRVLIIGGGILFFSIVDNFIKYIREIEKNEKRKIGCILIISVICCITPFILGTDMILQYHDYEKKENEIKLYDYMEDLHCGIVNYLVDYEREDNNNQNGLIDILCEGGYLSELQKRSEWKDVLRYSGLIEENKYNDFLETVKQCGATDLFIELEMQDSEIERIKISAVGTSLEVY